MGALLQRERVCEFGDFTRDDNGDRGPDHRCSDHRCSDHRAPDHGGSDHGGSTTGMHPLACGEPEAHPFSRWPAHPHTCTIQQHQVRLDIPVTCWRG